MMIVDTHMHISREYDVSRILYLCASRLHALAADCVPIACLTERHDCHIYADLLKTGVESDDYIVGCEVLEGGRSIVVRFHHGVPPLFLIPGRQIATKERLEVHCLGNDAFIADGEETKDAIARTLELDATAVLPWGVGKWTFTRRRLVESLMDLFSPAELMLGDSAMRPNFWGEPVAMRKGRLRGYRVLAGSDPLPHELGGRWVGTYATKVESPFHAEAPAKSCLRGLQQGSLALVGKRPGLIGFSQRMRG